MLTPVRTTLVFGLISAATLASLLGLFPHLLDRSTVMQLLILLNLGIYSLLLCHWSGREYNRLIYPLVIAAGSALWPTGQTGFMLLILALFGWVRSTICFPRSPLGSLLVEILLLTGGGGLLLAWPVTSPLAAGLTCWLFFLVQSLYFFIAPSPPADPGAGPEDVFERTYREAGRLLADP